MRVLKNKILNNLCLPKAYILAITILYIQYVAIAQNNIRLSKETYNGNDFKEVIAYSYDDQGKIKKIMLSQDGKLHSTTTDFKFNSDGLLTSYLNTYNLNISPQLTTITYDAQKRLLSYITKKTQTNVVVKSKTYSYNGDTVIVNAVGLITYYIYNADSNITKAESTNQSSSAFTNLYNKYDNSKNPHLILGGYIDDKPISLHNSLEDNYVDIFIINRTIAYEIQFASQYKKAGVKIPTQYKNGLPLKITETRFDKAYNKVMPVSTTLYEYIKL